MKLSFIGLGRMGAGMAGSLLRAGFELTVYNRSQPALEALVGRGAHAAANVAAACDADVLISMLADDAAAEAVVLGEGGVLEHLPRDAIHLSMSTLSVALSKRLATAHASAGQRYVAAPVFGRPDAAAAAKLFIVAAGDSSAIAACQPLFDAMGQRTFPLGTEPSQANLVKLSGNFLLAAAIEALGEAIALVGKAGVDPEAFVDVLASSIFPAPAYRNYGLAIAQGKFEPAGFTAPLGFKDIRFVLQAAEALEVPLPLAGLLRDRFLRLLAGGGERLDWAAIGGLAGEDAGRGQT